MLFALRRQDSGSVGAVGGGARLQPRLAPWSTAKRVLEALRPQKSGSVETLKVKPDPPIHLRIVPPPASPPGGGMSYPTCTVLFMVSRTSSLCFSTAVRQKTANRLSKPSR